MKVTQANNKPVCNIGLFLVLNLAYLSYANIIHILIQKVILDILNATSGKIYCYILYENMFDY